MRVEEENWFFGWIRRFFRRIFHYPLRNEPSTYVLQRHYNSMGELLPLEQRPSRPQGYHLNALEAAEAELIARLRALRQRRFEAAFVHTDAPAPVAPPPPRHEHAHAHRPSLGDREAHGRAGVMHTFNHYHAVEQGDLDKWPGWDAATLQNVFNVYVQYFDGERGLVEERWASAMSADLGDRSPRALRRARFQAVASTAAAAAATATATATPSAWIAFPQMLDLLYSADAQTDEEALTEGLGEPLMRRLADDERHLLRRIYGLAHPHGGSEAEAEADAGEDTRLRPLAKACLRKSRRAHILATMSAHAQIGYGFL